MNIRYVVWTYKLCEDQTRTASAGLVAQARARQPVKVMMQPWMLVLPWPGMADSASCLCPALSPVSSQVKPRPPPLFVLSLRKWSILLSSLRCQHLQKVSWSKLTSLVTRGWCACARVLSLIRSVEFWLGRQHSLLTYLSHHFIYCQALAPNPKAQPQIKS